MDNGSTTSTLGALQTSVDDPLHYAFSGKLMLISVFIFFFVCLFIAFFHLYVSRFFLRHTHHLQQYHRRYRQNPTSATTVSSQGLDLLLLKSLPVFIYASELHQPPMECPVCLSEFENGEAGRVLPKCNHSFHCECIDMWFQFHSSCPICRTPVQSLVNKIEVMEHPSELEQFEVVVLVAESACEELQQKREHVGTINGV